MSVKSHYDAHIHDRTRATMSNQGHHPTTKGPESSINFIRYFRDLGHVSKKLFEFFDEIMTIALRRFVPASQIIAGQLLVL